MRLCVRPIGHQYLFALTVGCRSGLGLMSHPLWSRTTFERHFNSASYTAARRVAVRLLRASCGQPSHTRHQPADNECYLFDNFLAKLGFTRHLMMDHNGGGGFLKFAKT